jgi:uncharacterized protein
MTDTTPSWHRGDWMQTYTGRKFYPTSPSPDDVDIQDIAHALSMLCRYNGHVTKFYSVAEHCVLMSQAVTPQRALEALLHDATEAYVGDMIRPLKHQPQMFPYRDAEADVMEAIAYRFDLPRTPNFLYYQLPPEVKDADNRILLTERKDLMKTTDHTWNVDTLTPLPVQIRGWAPYYAERQYLSRFEELTS